MLKPLAEFIGEIAGDVRTLDAASAVKESEQNGGIIIDVRETAEVDTRKGRGTTHIPRGILEMKLPGLVPDSARPIYLHCATSGRARLCAAQLEKLGYTNVNAISCDIDSICTALGEEG
jgi:phage shock protein E